MYRFGTAPAPQNVAGSIGSGSATLVVTTLSSIQCVATTSASIPYVMLLLPRPLFLMQRHY